MPLLSQHPLLNPQHPLQPQLLTQPQHLLQPQLLTQPQHLLLTLHLLPSSKTLQACWPRKKTAFGRFFFGC